MVQIRIFFSGRREGCCGYCPASERCIVCQYIYNTLHGLARTTLQRCYPFKTHKDDHNGSTTRCKKNPGYVFLIIPLPSLPRNLFLLPFSLWVSRPSSGVWPFSERLGHSICQRRPSDAHPIWRWICISCGKYFHNPAWPPLPSCPSWMKRNNMVTACFSDWSEKHT